MRHPTIEEIPLLQDLSLEDIYWALLGSGEVLEEDPSSLMVIAEGQGILCSPLRSICGRKWYANTPIARGTVEEIEDFILGLVYVPIQPV